MTKKSVRKNYIYNVCYQILVLIIPLITTPYISRVLGADGIGVVSYAESVVSYFVLFGTLGITTYGQREISYVQDSIEKRSITFWNIKLFEITSGGIALILYVLYMTYETTNHIYYFLIFQVVAVIVDITWFYQGLEEFGKIVAKNIFFKSLNIVYLFGFVRSADDIYKYAFGLAFFTFLGNLSLWWNVRKYITRISVKELQPFKRTCEILLLFIPAIAINVYTVLDKTMIGIITQDSFQNGYYEQAIKISKLVLTLVTSLGTVIMPRIGYYFKQGDTCEVTKLMYNGFKFVFLLGIPLCIGLMIVSSNFVPWFYGSGYENVILLLKILPILIIVIGISNITGTQYLIPTKRENLLTLTVVLGALTNFSLNTFMIRIYGAMGAAIASVIAETVIAVSQLLVLRRELSIIEIFKGGANYYIASIIMAILLYWSAHFFMPSIVNTFILILIGFSSYVILLIVLRDDFFLFNITKIMYMIRKRR